MHLILFDIDGTLTRTCAADSACFIRAVSEELSLSGVESDWNRYRHVTESCIVTELSNSRSIGLLTPASFQDCAQGLQTCYASAFWRTRHSASPYQYRTRC
jgi:hypothetical protein